MKKFFNGYTIAMSVLFILGLVGNAACGNWTAFLWVLTAALWFVAARTIQLAKEVTELEYEDHLLSLRTQINAQINTTESYRHKYEEKLSQNYKLACDNKNLAEQNIKLTKELANLMATPEEVKTPEGPEEGTGKSEEVPVTEQVSEAKPKGKKKSGPMFKAGKPKKTE